MACGCAQPDVELAAAARHPRELVAVGREMRPLVDPGIVGDLAQVAAVERDGIDVPVAITVRVEIHARVVRPEVAAPFMAVGGRDDSDAVAAVRIPEFNVERAVGHGPAAQGVAVVRPRLYSLRRLRVQLLDGARVLMGQPCGNVPKVESLLRLLGRPRCRPWPRWRWRGLGLFECRPKRHRRVVV